jgi:hypothetical protein
VSRAGHIGKLNRHQQTLPGADRLRGCVFSENTHSSAGKESASSIQTKLCHSGKPPRANSRNGDRMREKCLKSSHESLRIMVEAYLV